MIFLACAPPPSLHAEVGEGAVFVEASEPLSSVVIVDGEGVPLARSLPSSPTARVGVPVPPGVDGAAVVVATVGGVELRVPVNLDEARADLWVTVAAPVGAAPVRVQDGDVVPLVLVDGAPANVGVGLKAASGGPVELLVEAGEFMEPDPTTLELVAGVRVATELSVAVDTPVVVQSPGASVSFRLDTTTVSSAALRDQLDLGPLAFPATESGAADIVRAPGRVALPSRWWTALLRHTPLGVDVRDVTTPWAWAGVPVRNDADTPLDVVIRGRMLDGAGEADAAFRPRVREGDDGTGHTSVFLRVPPHSTASATLPVYVDELNVGDGPWTYRVELLGPGHTIALATGDTAIYLSRGSSLVSASFALALGAAAAGALLVVTHLRRWLAQPTGQLVTLACFASVQFVVGTAAQIVGLGVAAALGPFATMLTGLLDDALAVTLLATLVSLQPRVGTVALCSLLAWGLRGLATGALNPMDALFVASRVCFYEGALYLAGLTRGGAWRDSPALSRWLRLGFGFGLASVLSAATSMVLHTVLYRLFFAEWYVVMIVLGPGLIYTLAAVGVADRVAQSLRRVED